MLWNLCYHVMCVEPALMCKACWADEGCEFQVVTVKNPHPTNRSPVFWRWSMSIFCFRKIWRSASWQAGILLQWSRELFQCLSTVSTDFRCHCRNHVRMVLSHPLSYVWTGPVLTGLLDVCSQFPVRLPGPMPKTQWWVRHSDLANLSLGWMNNVGKGCSSRMRISVLRNVLK